MHSRYSDWTVRYCGKVKVKLVALGVPYICMSNGKFARKHQN